MKIFKNEKDIESKILASTSVFSPVKIKSAKKETTEEIRFLIASYIDNLEDDSFKKVFASDKHPFLMYLSAILCSTVINHNDDTFIPSELWKARSTIKDQPFNEEHEERRIIGHVINYRALDADGKIIAEDAVEIPSYIDIEFDAVLYESIYPEIAEEIVENSEAGKIGVSMECAIRDFAYGILDDNKLTIIERNEETSSLSKYLRAYGGTGVYNSKRIVRVLKDLTFVGVANTTNPANDASLYTKINNNIVQATDFNCINNKNTDKNITEGNEMTLEEALGEIKKLNEELTKIKSEDKDKKIKDLENSLVVANEKFANSETTIATLNKNLADKDAELTKANEDLTVAKTELDKAVSERDTFKATIEKAEARKLGETRVAAMKALGHDFGDKEDEAIEKYSKFDETSYNEIYAAIQKHAKPTEAKIAASVTAAIDSATSTETASVGTVVEKNPTLNEVVAASYGSSSNKRKKLSTK